MLLIEISIEEIKNKRLTVGEIKQHLQLLARDYFTSYSNKKKKEILLQGKKLFELMIEKNFYIIPKFLFENKIVFNFIIDILKDDNTVIKKYFDASSVKGRHNIKTKGQYYIELIFNDIGNRKFIDMKKMEEIIDKLTDLMIKYQLINFHYDQMIVKWFVSDLIDQDVSDRTKIDDRLFTNYVIDKIKQQLMKTLNTEINSNSTRYKYLSQETKEMIKNRFVEKIKQLDYQTLKDNIENFDDFYRNFVSYFVSHYKQIDKMLQDL